MKLRCENLVKKYGVRTVVKGVSMEVNQGEIVGFLGPNGAGKTTSFYMITGQIVPNEGKVFLEDEEITGLPMYKRAQKGIGYLPQDASVFRKMSVEDNIMSVMEMSGMGKAERKERLESLIAEFNLLHLRRRIPLSTVHYAVSTEIVIRRPLSKISAVSQKPLAISILLINRLVHVIPDKAALITHISV